MQSYLNQPNGVFPAVCSLDCPDQCGLLIHKIDGKIVKINGDPQHPVTNGSICNKVRHMAERIYDPKRLQHPLKRIGPKGEGSFKRISWEEAIATITSHWKGLIATDGAESILPYSFYGNMGRLNAEAMDMRFFHRLGASRLDRTICSSAGSKGYNYTMGSNYGVDPEDTIHAKLFIMWGINAISTNMHQVVLAEKARKNGAFIVVIDVHKHQTSRWADWFVPILPGTDSALALGLMHILFAEGMVDTAFLQQYTVGHEELRKHVIQYDPVSVSAITGVPVEDIYKLARLYGQTSPSFIRIGNGLQHHDNGGMCVRTISCLPALTGQWLVRGGGAIKGNSSYLAFNKQALQRPDLLQNKQVRLINMNAIGNALLELNPPVRSMYVYNSNPALVAPEGNKVRRGLEREDLFTVVHDLFLTETALYADLVLPATSSFENEDFYTSYWHHYIQIQQPVIEKFGESKSNVEVFRLLAKGMGYDEPMFNDSEEDMIRQALAYPQNIYLEGIDYDTLVEKQYMKARIKSHFLDNLATPSGKIELFSKAMDAAGYPPLPTYIPLVEDGNYPYLFVPGPNHHFINSTFAHNAKHVEMEKTIKLYMNSADALAASIKDGDTVRIWNDRGDCELVVSVGDTVMQGVLVSQGLWADSPGAKHAVNLLTPDRIADMGGGATFFSGRVDVAKLSNKFNLEYL